MSLTLTFQPAPAPLPADFDLLPFEFVWMHFRALHDPALRRLERRGEAQAVLCLLRLYVAQWQTRGGGMPNDPDFLADAAGVDPDVWLDRIKPLLAPFLRVADNGLVYVDWQVEAALAAWKLRYVNVQRTASARAAAAEARAEVAAQRQAQAPEAPPALDAAPYLQEPISCSSTTPEDCAEVEKKGSVTSQDQLSVVVLKGAVDNVDCGPPPGREYAAARAVMGAVARGWPVEKAAALCRNALAQSAASEAWLIARYPQFRGRNGIPWTW
jgi:hypothetical protein